MADPGDPGYEAPRLRAGGGTLDTNESNTAHVGRLLKNAGALAGGGVFIILMVAAGIAYAGCRNHHTPPGHVGYIRSRPFLGAGEFVDIQTGPTSTGLAWRLEVVNIDVRPRTFSEVMKIPTRNRLEVELRAHARVRLDARKLRELVETYGGEKWYENNVRDQYRSAVRDKVQQLDVFEVKNEMRAIGDEVLADMQLRYKDTGIEFLSVDVGDIVYPKGVVDSVIAKFVTNEENERKDVELEIAQRQIEIGIAEAEGIADAQRIIRTTLDPMFLQFEALRAIEELRERPERHVHDHADEQDGLRPGHHAALGEGQVMTASQRALFAASIVFAIGLGTACTNPDVPHGHEGYIYHRPMLMGKMEYRDSLRGPATTGVSWRLYTENVDMRAKSYKEDFELLTSDNLNVSFEVNTRIKLKDRSVKEIVERWGGAGWYEANVKEPMRTIVREQVTRFSATDIQLETPKVKQLIAEKLALKFGDTPIMIESVDIGQIQFPGEVAEAISRKIAKKQELERQQFVLAKASKEAAIRVLEALRVAKQQLIISSTLDPLYVQQRAVQVYRTIGASANRTILVLPNMPEGTGMPQVLTEGKRKILTPADEQLLEEMETRYMKEARKPGPSIDPGTGETAPTPAPAPVAPETAPPVPTPAPN